MINERKEYEKCNAFRGFYSNGYDKSIKETLEGKANVIFPEENCRFASYLLRCIPDNMEKEDIKVIHWNAEL